MTEQRWVLAYDKVTGKRVDSVCCPKNNARFFEEKFRLEGYETKTLTDEEVDVLVQSENEQ